MEIVLCIIIENKFLMMMMMFTTLLLVHLHMFLKNLQLFCTHKNCRKSLNAYPIFCLITTPIAVLATSQNVFIVNSILCCNCPVCLLNIWIICHIHWRSRGYRVVDILRIQIRRIIQKSSQQLLPC